LKQDRIVLACKPTFYRHIIAGPQVTIMRALLASMLMLTSSALAEAAELPRLAVFDFEMIDSSLDGEMHGKRADEQARLMRTGDQVRTQLAESGRFQILDIAPVNAAAHQSSLQACGGCDVTLARELGYDVEITGVVQKVSNLILNINAYLRDVHTGKLVAGGSVDMRGNTDESWSRATRYLVRERLLAPSFGTPPAR
jgi:Protein of unknown function (DUF2380)